MQQSILNSLQQASVSLCIHKTIRIQLLHLSPTLLVEGLMVKLKICKCTETQTGASLPKLLKKTSVDI